MSVKIFLSTVTDEFRDYRDQLRSDLTRHNVEVKVQEDFKDYGGVTLDKLDLYIGHCDAIVHLIGDMTGSDAKSASTTSVILKYPDIAERLSPLRELVEQGLGISYTQWEAWLALYHGKALLIATPDAAAPRGPKYAPTDASRAAQKAHLQRLGAIEHYPGCSFTSPDNLAKQILSSTILDLLVKEQRGQTSQAAENPLYSTLIVVIFLLQLMPPMVDQLTKVIGLAFAALIYIVVAAIGLIFWRYLRILGVGGSPPGSLERQAYEALRESLATGGRPVRLYSRWLTKCLDMVDRFFGDAGMTDRTLFPHVFWLRTPAPLWTAPAFDRCLLLALIYPIFTILIIWAVSGDVGPAAALGLRPDLAGWRRGLLVAMIGTTVFALWRGSRASGPKSAAWLAVAFASAVAVSFAGFFAVLFASIIAYNLFASRFAESGTFAGIFAGAFATALPGTSAGLLFGIFTGTVLVALTFLNEAAVKHRWHGYYLSLFVPGMTVIACLYAIMLSPSENWETSGPLVLFLGLLTLINAPFDWASLGLTRALLRRGLELGGWWPYFLALVDALFAGVIITLLAFTMIVGVQIFDHLAEHSGGDGKAILPLDQLFEGIAAQPADAKYWWVYALLLSTMIPSIINLVISGVALARTVPGLPLFLLRYIPSGCAVPVHDRLWVACVLTLQVAIGVFLGVTAQALLVLWLYIMPRFGLGLLELSRDFAAFDLPMRLWQVFGGMWH